MKQILFKYCLFCVILLMLLLTACGSDDSDKKGTLDSGGIYQFQQEGVELDKREVTLYYPSYADGFLHAEKRQIFETESLTNQAKQTIVELIKGPKSKLMRIIPSRVKLRELYRNQKGTAYIDLSSEFINGLRRGGTETELLLIYSIVNTLTENFSEIKNVSFLIEGKQVKTLNGHLDMTVLFRGQPGLIIHRDIKGEAPDSVNEEDEVLNDES